MTTLTITLNLDNDAFQDLNGQNEVARILTKYATYISEHGLGESKLHDINGNTTGFATLTQQED